MRLVWGLLLSLSGVAQQPQNHPKSVDSAKVASPKRSDENKKTKSIERNAGTAITAIPKLEAQLKQSQTETSNHKATQEQKSDPNYWIMWFTLGLVLVGALQTRILSRQTHIINESLIETRRATELTRVSLILTQRPRLAVRNLAIDEPTHGARFISRGGHTDPTFLPEVAVLGRLSVVNSGNGRATIVNSYCRIFNSGPPESLLMDLPYDPAAGNGLLDPNVVLAPGQAIERRFSGNGPSVEQLNHAEGPDSGLLYLYVLGWIDYRDDLNITRRMAFCRRYDRGLDRFVRVRDEDYENAD